MTTSSDMSKGKPGTVMVSEGQTIYSWTLTWKKTSKLTLAGRLAPGRESRGMRSGWWFRWGFLRCDSYTIWRLCADEVRMDVNSNGSEREKRGNGSGGSTMAGGKMERNIHVDL